MTKTKYDNKFKMYIITKQGANISLRKCQGTARKEVIYDFSWKKMWIRYHSNRKSKKGISGINKRCEAKGTKKDS